MDDLIRAIAVQLDGAPTHQLSNQLGADPRATQNAVNAALPVLLGALARNTASSGGADALAGALDRDHDGSILDDLGGFLGAGQAGDGAAILGHVLGSRQRTVQAGIGQATGLQSNQVGQLLQMLAPIVLAYLGRQKRQRGLDPAMLGQELGAQLAQGRAQNPALGALTALLDRDDDGTIVDDLGGMLGSLLSRR